MNRLKRGSFPHATLAAGLAAVLALASGAQLAADQEPEGEDPAPAAAESPDPEDRPGDRPLVYDEIIVTSERREERVQKVPLAVTVFPAEEIESAGIETTEDFVSLTPNALLGDSFTVGSSFITIRGVTQLNNGDPPVAMVMDGVYLPNQKQIQRELFDVERIEVLRGPQGALYGRNALGGVFQIVTMRPTEELDGYLEAGAGSGSSYSVRAAAGGALVPERLRVRAAGSYRDSEGLIENSFLDDEVDFYEDTSGRVHLEWLAGERVTFDLRAGASRTEGGAITYALFPPEGFANDFRFAPDENIRGTSERDMDDYSLTARWRTPHGELTAIAAYSDITESYRGDADFSNPERGILTPFGQLGQGQDQDLGLWSQEVRFSSPGDRPLRWIVGGYLLETDRALTTTLFADTDGTFAGFFPLLTLAEDNDNTSYAFYEQTEYDLAPRWRVSGSLRYDRDDRTQLDLGRGVERSRSFDQWQPRVALSYLPNEDLMVYVNLARGFRSGGFNAPTVDPDVFDSETSDTVEVGAKSTAWGGRLLLDGVAYLMAVDEAQFFRVDLATASQIIDNIKEVEVRGAEVTARARLTRPWEVYGALGVNDSEIQDFDGTGSFEGKQTPNNIRYTVNLGSRYTVPIGSALLGFGRLDLERRGKQYWHPDNLDVQDPVTLVDFRIGVEAEAWSISAFVENATDEEYYVEYADARWSGLLSGDDLGQPGKPRFFGVELRRRF